MINYKNILILIAVYIIIFVNTTFEIAMLNTILVTILLCITKLLNYKLKNKKVVFILITVSFILIMTSLNLIFTNYYNVIKESGLLFLMYSYAFGYYIQKTKVNYILFLKYISLSLIVGLATELIIYGTVTVMDISSYLTGFRQQFIIIIDTSSNLSREIIRYGVTFIITGVVLGFNNGIFKGGN